jgi:TRAP-type mannitol/chloroaromatic compound transport system substrate-binding protein
MDGAFGQDLLAKFQKRGLIALAWGEQGFRHLSNNKHAVNGVADLKGLKIRVTENPVHITAFRTLGASPTPCPGPKSSVRCSRARSTARRTPSPCWCPPSCGKCKST